MIARSIINPYFASRMNGMPAKPFAGQQKPVYAKLPLAPINASPVPCILQQGGFYEYTYSSSAARSERSERSAARRSAASSVSLRPTRPQVSVNPADRIPKARTVAGAVLCEPVSARKGTRMSAEFVGIDVSKEWLDVYLLNSASAARF